MSHKYQQSFTTPDNFQNILRDFAREVLRAQPSNVYEFGYLYFTRMANDANDPMFSRHKNIHQDRIIDISPKEAPKEEQNVALPMQDSKSQTSAPQSSDELKDRLIRHFATIDPTGIGASTPSNIKKVS